MKTKERSLKELLIVVKENKMLFQTGLCLLIADLFFQGDITKKEWQILDRFIDEHPTKRYDHHLYYWPMCKWAPRGRWLNKWIKKLETK